MSARHPHSKRFGLLSLVVVTAGLVVGIALDLVVSGQGTLFPYRLWPLTLCVALAVVVVLAVRNVRASAQQSQNADSIFRGLLESAGDAMVIMDSSGRVVLVNRQMEALVGY